MNNFNFLILSLLPSSTICILPRLQLKRQGEEQTWNLSLRSILTGANEIFNLWWYSKTSTFVLSWLIRFSQNKTIWDVAHLFNHSTYHHCLIMLHTAFLSFIVLNFKNVAFPSPEFECSQSKVYHHLSNRFCFLPVPSDLQCTRCTLFSFCVHGKENDVHPSRLAKKF